MVQVDIKPLFGLHGSSARGFRRPALGLAVLTPLQRVSLCVLRLPVRRSITCFLLRCQHAWRLQSATTGAMRDEFHVELQNVNSSVMRHPKVSEVPAGANVELGRHIVTVGLKRLHCTGASY